MSRKNKITMDDIRIKEVVGYEGLYLVTSCGKVWSIAKQKFLPIKYTTNGKARVELYKNGVRKWKQVHQLVAEAYIDNPDPERLIEVDHIEHECGTVALNYVNNLRWVEHTVNCCNKPNSRPVYNTMTGGTYCTMAMAARETGTSESTVKRNCEKFRNEHILQKFVYMEDMTFDMHRKYYKLNFTDLERNLRV